jgi:hypothetical protein
VITFLQPVHSVAAVRDDITWTWYQILIVALCIFPAFGWLFFGMSKLMTYLYPKDSDDEDATMFKRIKRLLYPTTVVYLILLFLAFRF